MMKKMEVGEGRILHHRLRYVLRAGEQVLQERVNVEVHDPNGKVYYIWDWTDVPKVKE